MDINGNKVIAVDFDKTLSMANWPEVGNPNTALFDYLIHEKEKGSLIILNSCRTGEILENAVAFCAENGLYFDAINENIPTLIEKFGDDPRKISADIYIDDKAYNPHFMEGIYIRKDEKSIHIASKLTRLGLEDLIELNAFLEIHIETEIAKSVAKQRKEYVQQAVENGKEV